MRFLVMQLRQGLDGHQRLLTQAAIAQQRRDGYGPATTLQYSPYAAILMTQQPLEGGSPRRGEVRGAARAALKTDTGRAPDPKAPAGRDDPVRSVFSVSPWWVFLYAILESFYSASSIEGIFAHPMETPVHKQVLAEVFPP